MKNDNNLIKKLYIRSLYPNILAVLGGTINVFFDAVFVGQKLGSGGLESVNQCLPVYLLLCTVGSLFASGASCLSAMAYGENKSDEAVRIFHVSVFLSFIVSAFLCVIGIFTVNPVSRILSTDVSYDYVRTYLKITYIGGMFKTMLYIPFFYLRLEGKNGRSMAAMLTMTILNILLDYLFLFKLELGIAGAAWASIIATMAAVFMSFVFLFSGKTNFAPGIKVPKKKDLYAIIKYGSPMALNNILSSLKIFCINLILKLLGASGMTSIFAAINNISEFSICVQNGVPQTATAMTAVFFGEKDTDSIKGILRLQLRVGVILSIVCAVVLIIISGRVGAIFGIDYDCRIASICFAICLPFAVMNNVLSYYYNNVGQIAMANMITAVRTFVFMVLFCLVFCSFGQAVWLFYPATEIACLLTILGVGKLRSRKDRLDRFYMLDDSLEKNGQSISFLVDCASENICGASEKIRDFCEANEFTPKTTMTISLAIEEILTIIAQKSLDGNGHMDVRVFKNNGEGIMRVRSQGRRYNPIDEKDDSLDYIGVQMICKLAKNIEYHSTLGMNTLIIFFDI